MSQILRIWGKKYPTYILGIDYTKPDYTLLIWMETSYFLVKKEMHKNKFLTVKTKVYFITLSSQLKN